MIGAPGSIESQSTWRRACAATLAHFPQLGPTRLSALLADAPPEVALEALANGQGIPAAVARVCGSRFGELTSMWKRAARAIDPLEVLERYEASCVDVLFQLDAYPRRLDHDPFAPAVLFAQGSLRGLDCPTVAIIGTRHCTHEGRSIARRLGADLAEAGVSVVSGLALGIDGAAHQGALEAIDGAPPIAVVGSGLDVVYPRKNGALWKRVAETGAVVSEAPLGAAPEPWRFPARNRIIAALADVVVVVESHEHGGSLLTVDEADTRGVPILAVPGSINSPASRGTNHLIAANAAGLIRGVEDVLNMLPLDIWSQIADETETAPDDPLHAEVLDGVGWEPTSTEDVLSRSQLDLPDVMRVLMSLQQQGWITCEEGWWRRSGRRAVNDGERNEE